MPERRFILKEYAPQIAQKRGGQLSQRIRSCSSFRTLRLLLAVVLLGSFAPLNPTAAQQGEPQAMTLYSGVPDSYGVVDQWLDNRPPSYYERYKKGNKIEKTEGHKGCCKDGTWPSLEGANWIWKATLVTMDEAQRGSYPIYFYRFFDVPYEADPNSITGTLVIAADNYYRAWVNDMPYHYEGSWEIPKGFPLEDDTPDHHTLLWPGTNLLVVEVINAAQPWGNPSTNPAGLIYQLHITYRLP